MNTQLTVILKNEESSFRQKFNLYEEYKLTDSDQVVKRCIEEAKNNSKIQPDEVVVKAVLSL